MALLDLIRRAREKTGAPWGARASKAEDYSRHDVGNELAVDDVLNEARLVGHLPPGTCPICFPHVGAGQDDLFGRGLPCGRCGRSVWRPSGKGDGFVICAACHPPGHEDEPVAYETLVAPGTCPVCDGPAWCVDGRWSCEQCEGRPEAAPVIDNAVTRPGSHAERQDLLTAAAACGFPRVRLRPGVWVAAGEALWRKFCENATAEDFVAAAAYFALLARDEVEPEGPEAAEASQR